jgi:hypothetical protein
VVAVGEVAGCHTRPSPAVLVDGYPGDCPPRRGHVLFGDRAALADVTRLALMVETGGGMRRRRVCWSRRVVGLVSICSGYDRVRCGPVTDLVTPRPAVALTKRQGARVRMAGRSYGPQTPVYTLL